MITDYWLQVSKKCGSEEEEWSKLDYLFSWLIPVSQPLLLFHKASTKIPHNLYVQFYLKSPMKENYLSIKIILIFGLVNEELQRKIKT